MEVKSLFFFFYIKAIPRFQMLMLIRSLLATSDFSSGGWLISSAFLPPSFFCLFCWLIFLISDSSGCHNRGITAGAMASRKVSSFLSRSLASSIRSRYEGTFMPLRVKFFPIF